MCGIAGIVNFATNSEINRVLVEKMTATLIHRGPDASGIHAAKDHCFGHRRLSIIDVENGRQPMVSKCGRYSLTFNGEIYNYLELRKSLESLGQKFETASDTEVLLQCLIRRGKDALQDLNGMYAFAFFDAEKREVLLARDRFGIKPLYYTLTDDGSLVFASEIKALLRHPTLRAEVNHGALQEYLTFQFCLNDRTFFKNIVKLEPGHLLKLDPNGSKIEKYWDLNYEIDTDHSQDYFRDHLAQLLEESVRLQVRSDVPVGAYLSGGLDSSVVSTLAADFVTSGIKVFTGKFDESPSYDESAYAKAVAKKIGATYFEVVPSAHQFVDCLPNLIYHLDEPIAGPGLFPQYLVSKKAAEEVKVVLGGQGGDEVFGGYARYLIGYLEQALKGSIFETQEEGSHIVTLESIIPNLPLLREYLPLMQHFWRDGLFEPMDARYFRLINRSPDLENLLNRDYYRSLDLGTVYANFQKIFNCAETPSYLNKMTHFDLKTLLPALLQVEDRMSMAVSVESRVPLLDHRIVELVNRMPPATKFQGGKTKSILKRAIGDRLPPEVMHRKDKMGFPVPVREWMQKGPVREFVNDILFSATSRARGIFDIEGLRKSVEHDTTFGRQLWGALCIELWHRQFIDNQDEK